MADPHRAPEFVTLREGMTVPLSALELLWALEGRGVSVSVEPETNGFGIYARPHEAVSVEDRRLIHKYRFALAVLVRAADAASAARM